MAIYALLVGINNYLAPTNEVKPLQGCVNDVEAFSEVLQSRFSVDAEHIVHLVNDSDEKSKTFLFRKDGDATRGSIINYFYDHLIKKCTKDDVAVFYFSGHGAQSFTNEIFHDIEPDGLDESLVCHDSRTNGIPDLRDKDLSFLLKELEKREVGHIVVFLDCCHGGDGTRYIDKSLQNVRSGETDTRSYPISSYLFASDPSRPLTKETAKEQLAVPTKHILLAACRDYQVSKEARQEGVYHGYFTYALCNVLKTLQYKVSYHELISRIHAYVQSQNPNQSPQLEAYGGMSGREEILGGEILPVSPIVFSRDKGMSSHDKEWVTNVGSIHGFKVGDEIALFAGEVYKDYSHAPLVRLKSVNASESVVELIPSEAGQESQLLNSKVQYNGLIVKRSFQKMAIRFGGKPDKLQELEKKLADVESSSFGLFLCLSEDSARYEIVSSGDGFFVTHIGDSRPLFEKGNLDQVLGQLEVMARWWRKLDIDNYEPHPELPSDTVEIVMRYKDTVYVTENISKDQENEYISAGSKMVEKNVSEIIIFHEGDECAEIKFELRLNKKYPAKKPLYYGFFHFSEATGEVLSSYYLNASGILVNGEYALGVNGQLIPVDNQFHGQPNEVCKVSIFEKDFNTIGLVIQDSLHVQGVTKVQDFFKIIVSEIAFDTAFLEQDGNPLYTPNSKGVRGAASQLNSLLEEVMEDSHFRASANRSRNKSITNWYAKTVAVTIIRPQTAQAVNGENPASFISREEDKLDVKIEPHVSFRGKVRLINSQADHSKAVGSKMSVAEPAIFTNPEALIDFSEGRGIDLGLDAMEIFVNSGVRGDTDDSTTQISAENPLKISINQSLDEGEYIIPYTCDAEGKRFLPIGLASSKDVVDERTFIRIEELPEEAVRAPEGEKGIGGSLKIFFRKLIYRQLLRIDDKSTHVLAIPVFADDDSTKVIDYKRETQSVAAEVANAQRILLIMHGIIGQTDTMAGFVNQPHTDGKQYVRDQYDLVLAFDYENLNTYIQDTAKALKESLQAVGIVAGCGKQLDIVAHSMGGLVSRYFIEREDGAAIVRKLVMVGTPNGGSPSYAPT